MDEDFGTYTVRLSGFPRCWNDGGVKLGILCGGGPAPGMNSVISAATIEARNFESAQRKADFIKERIERQTEWSVVELKVPPGEKKADDK